MRYFLLFFVLFFYSLDVFAATAETTQNMNLGTYIQTATTASGVLSYSSSISNLSGIVQGSSSEKNAAIIQLTGSRGNDRNSITIGTSSVVLSGTSGCTITVDSFTLSSSSVTPGNKQTADIQVGATIHFSGGFCEEGTFYGTGSIGYKNRTQYYQEFDIQVTVEAPLSIEETQGMNFGTFLSPNANASITLSPAGSYTTSGNVNFVDSNLNASEFTVTGVGSRQVSITLPGSTTLTNTSGYTMTADSFTSDPGDSFTLSGTGTGKTQDIKVGSTLHINKNQKAGNYTGTYPVIVSY